MDIFTTIEYKFYSDTNFSTDDYDTKITDLFKNHP